MRGLRNSESVIALVVLASLVGHVAIQRHFERRSQAMLRLALTERTSSAKSNSCCPPMDLADVESLRLPRFLSDLPSSERILPALEVQGDDRSQRPDPEGNPPRPVPAPTDADVASQAQEAEDLTDARDSSGVRAVIEEELSHATREEREIWYEELKSVPADVVRDLLKVRKQMHALPKLLGNIPEKLASTDTSTSMSPLPREVSAETASQRIRFNLPDYLSATASLETAVSQLRHNLTNVATPGFKRLRVTLVDCHCSVWNEPSTPAGSNPESVLESRIQGEGCRMAPLSLDLKQGSLKKTNRQFDLAIEGDGFFVVRQGEKQFLTRCGALSLDRDRQLCLVVTSELSLLQPPIKIPDDAREIQISAQGIVTMLKSDESDLAQIGQLQLGRVPSPARLSPVGSTLLVANEASGAVMMGLPMSDAFGEIQQGCLEESNVDFERELEEIDKLSSILKALPSATSRSATARNSSQAPHR